MKYLGILFFVILLFGVGCTRQPTTKTSVSMPQAQKVTFQTSDSVAIVGDYVDAGAGAPQALLLHMMPATRSSFALFALKLREAGISSLAIDLRGHGESTKQGGRTLDYRNFTDAQQQAKILDVAAAAQWLIENHGAKKEKLALVGASIGANLALQYLKENPEVPAVVLLSPGLDYRGVLTQPLAQLLRPTQAVYFAASADDEYSLSTNRTLYGVTPAKRAIKEFKTAEHGTTMFEREEGFMEEVVEWIKKNVE